MKEEPKVVIKVRGSLNDWTKKYVGEAIEKQLKSLRTVYMPFLISLSSSEMPTLKANDLILYVGYLPNRTIEPKFMDQKLTIGKESVSYMGEGYSKETVTRAMADMAEKLTGTITDDADRVLALVSMNSIHLTLNPFDMNKKNTYEKEVERISQVAEFVLKKINDYLTAHPLSEEALTEYKMRRFVKSYFSNLEAEKQQIQTRIDEYNRNIKSYSESLGNAIAAIKTQQKLLNGLKNTDVDKEIKTLDKKLVAVKNHPKVIDVDYTEDGIKIRTKDMVCSRPNFGEYVIYLKKNSIKIKRGKATSGYQHPHISSDGTPCLGEFSGVVQYLADGQFDAVLEILIAFIESYNRDSAYIPMDEFLKAIKAE